MNGVTLPFLTRQFVWRIDFWQGEKLANMESVKQAKLPPGLLEKKLFTLMGNKLNFLFLNLFDTNSGSGK